MSSFGAAVSDGWLYVYGGHCAKTHNYSTESVVGDFYRLRLDSPDGWEKLPAGPPSQGLALVAHGGKLYRIGGMQPDNAPGDKADNHSLASCGCYDPVTGKWQPMRNLPEGRSSHDAVVVDDKIVVVGGWNMHGAGKATDWHSTVLTLDLKSKSPAWQSVKQPFQRRALTTTAHEGKVYVVGGMNEETKTLLTINVFDPAKNIWTLAPDIPGARRNGFAAASCSADGRLYVSPADGRLLRLSQKHDAWEEVGELKQSRIVHRIVPGKDNVLVVVGGASGGDNVALTEAVTPRPVNR